MQVRETGSPLLPKPVEQFRDYEHAAAAGRGVLPSESHAPDGRLRAREEARIPVDEAQADDGVRDARLSQHPRRRQRPRHRLHADRARDADGGGDPRRQSAALVHRHRPHPRSRQDSVPLRRAAVGGGRRYVPGRLPLVRRRSCTAISSSTTPTRHVPEYQTESTASTSPAAASTTFTCPGATTSTSTTSSRTTCREEALYMLRYHSFYPWHKESEYTPPHERDRSRHDEVGPRVQPLRSLFEGFAAAEGRRAHAVLPGARRGVLPRPLRW